MQPGSARVGSRSDFSSSRSCCSFPGIGSKRTKVCSGKESLPLSIAYACLQRGGSNGAQGVPRFRWQERHQTIPFLFGKNRVVERSVRQTRLGGTEYRNDSHASFRAAESETKQSVRGGLPFTDAQEFLPAAFLEAIVILLYAQRALPLFRNRHARKNRIGVVAVAAITDGTAIQSAPQFAGNRALGSALRFLGGSGDLDLTLPLDEKA